MENSKIVGLSVSIHVGSVKTDGAGELVVLTVTNSPQGFPTAFDKRQINGQNYATRKHGQIWTAN